MSGSARGLRKPQIAGLHPQDFWLAVLGWVRRLSILYKFPGDADTAGPGTTLWETLLLSLGGHVLLVLVSLLRYWVSTLALFLQRAACLSSRVQIQDIRHSRAELLNRWCTSEIHSGTAAVNEAQRGVRSPELAWIQAAWSVLLGLWVGEWLLSVKISRQEWRFILGLFASTKKSVPEEDVGLGFSGESVLLTYSARKSKNQGCFNYG